MINIRPVSDLRNKFPEVEADILEKDVPVFLTKNGYGTMVLMSIEQYSELVDPVEILLDEADMYAKETPVRYSMDEVFGRVRETIREE
ncbi:type II toxin-antitoxin system Phd/YefM family antitoxin [Veillonella caviae]|uniref:type II toxin-antitoxin system Phd/YefM family antitoxin n=1 Tax=Veillonella caviae TaxID=248316 RepID=UPI0023A86E53|nr:type II toxin-antitoxin system Phd/YefM family antitoxin [Veillonella caviae]MCI5709234.1 type II toxin-antitoxin system Phd/YefM family antitoxin [Veillonella caviae]MCI6407310.1 type II toxin-antitoxin system Phd/YefM family antitoxin [Veillonella caviae]MCI7694280.1 type II toxin-antitoxin system Phd/YefM family antitoxin [Veillonella caviae]MDD7291415.1 type II toxin-antitoxin system Phd/YefM family antitoxin [Veillonella caviae]MDY4747104.1 type II toxin-antitoxin system Phd/YefM famil